jgi:hypothetical protein
VLQAGISDFAKDTVLSLLQEFFSIEKNVGADLLYNREQSLSKISIVDKYTINLEEVDKRPAIVVIRGAQTWGRRGIGQFEGWTGPNTGEKFTDLVNGAVNCTCMSTNGLEAERIAWITFAFFQMFRRVIARGKLHDIQSVVLGEELAAQTDSKIDVSVVPVSLNLLFQWHWVLEQHGPPLGDVDVKVYQKNGETFTKFLASAKLA